MSTYEQKNCSNINSVNVPIESSENIYDKIDYISILKLVELKRSNKFSAIIMTRSENSVQVIAVGTGNQCVGFCNDENLLKNGKVLFDSHAEVIARRSFRNFLMKEIEFYKTGDQESIFEKDNDSNLLVLKEGIEFHLYISTAPCGDGALFTKQIETNPICVSEFEHKPLFPGVSHGKLRTKMKSGEGTKPLEENYISPELDKILGGERLRTMSCSDKICRWNLLGIQGSLLLHFIKPIYLKSISFGALYHSGHLSRACCCRLDKNYFEKTLNKPNNLFRLNHPALGCPTSFRFPREPIKTKSESLNWSLYEENAELTNGKTGLKLDREESRICKFKMFNRFKQLCTLSKTTEFDNLNYNEVKLKMEDYCELKQVFVDFLESKEYGSWVSKTAEINKFK